MPYRVLVVDDDPLVRKYVARGFSRAGFEVEKAASGLEAISLLQESEFDAVVSDLRMPNGGGLELLDFVQSLDNAPSFVLLTAYGTVRTAVEAVQHGADDFLEKPVEIDALVMKIQTLIETKRRRSGPHRAASRELVGTSAWVDGFRAALNQLARSDATLLIEGEVGTGKRHVARAVWQASYRSRRPFVVWRCGDIAEEQFDRQLFGEVADEEAGGSVVTPGALAKATGGAFVLEAVDELAPDLQIKLLRLMQERRYRPVGAKIDDVIDVRFIATTRRKLWSEVQAGRFRSELYFRLNILRLEVPSLRERAEDIPHLVDHFLEVFAIELAQPRMTITTEAIEALQEYPWPGNIRQLRNMIERLVRTAEGDVISVRRVRAELMQVPISSREPLLVHVSDSLPAVPVGTVQGKSLSDAVRNFERRLIESALAEAEGNRSKASHFLNISRTTLVEKIKRLGIDSKE